MCVILFQYGINNPVFLFDAANLGKSRTASQQGCSWPIQLICSLMRWDVFSLLSGWVAAPSRALSRSVAGVKCFDLETSNS